MNGGDGEQIDWKEKYFTLAFQPLNRCHNPQEADDYVRNLILEMAEPAGSVIEAA